MTTTTLSTRDAVAVQYPAALPLLDAGWTLTAALDHVQGGCDQALCFGDHTTDDALFGTCAQCGATCTRVFLAARDAEEGFCARCIATL